MNFSSRLLKVLAVALTGLTLSLSSPAFAAAAAPLGSLAQTEVGAAEGAEEDPGGEDGLGLEGMQNQMESLFKRLVEEPDVVLKEWALEDGPHLLGKLLLFVLILFVSRVVGRWVGTLTRGGLERSKLNASELFKNFVENTITKVVFFVGLIVALQTIGVNVAPLLAGVGVLGFVVGFVVDSVGDFWAGCLWENLSETSNY